MLVYILLACAWIIIGEALAIVSAVVAPRSLRNNLGSFAWYWASLRVLFWPLVLILVTFYALSIPVQIVWERQSKNEPPS